MIFTFREFQFPVNPQNLEIRENDRVRVVPLARDGHWIDERPLHPSSVKGTGIFTGVQSPRDFERLRREFVKGGSGVLLLGGYRIMDAVFRSLTCTGRQGDSVGYSFEFVETPVEKNSAEQVVHLVDEGENMWDIADKYGMQIERLMALNPSVSAPEDIRPGEEVFLC